ncbi:MAG: hypothetical protein AAB487_00155 [Patescibacteria group bacterium]
MKKSVKITLILLALLVLVIIGYFLVVKPKKTIPPSSVSPSAPTAEFIIPPPDAKKMTVPAEKESIDTNNLYNNPIYKLPDGTVTFLENSDYTMAFFPKDKLFNIAILSSTLKEARNKAEGAFLDTLGVTKDQACELNVSLGVPYGVSPRNSGLNFGLSFCPNGKPFE